MPRYPSNRVEYKGYVFDSKFECSTYQMLETYISPKRILVHKDIVVRPASNWFHEQTWKVDFTILDDAWNYPILFVESKGYARLDFKEKLKYIAYLFPKIYERLVVVMPQQTKVVRGLVAYDLKGLENYIRMSAFHQCANACKVPLKLPKAEIGE